MNGLKHLGGLIAGLVTENLHMLLLAVVTFCLVCIIQFVSTMVFGQGDFAGGSLARPVSDTIIQSK